MRRKIQQFLTTPIRLFSTSALAALALCIAPIGPQTLSAQIAANSAPGKGAIVKMDQATLHQFLRSAGYRTRGAGKIGRDKAESSDSSVRAFPHFSRRSDRIRGMD